MGTTEHGEGIKTVDTSITDIQEFCNDPSRFNIILMQTRPGIKRFCTRLEHEHFSPNDRALNNEFQFFMINFEGLTFFIVSIPADKKDLAYQMAAQTDMRIADGVPMLIGGEGFSRFPVNGDNSFTLENGPSHPVHNDGDMAEYERIEMEECIAIQDKTLAES